MERSGAIGREEERIQPWCKLVTVYNTSAVVGGVARLPCDLEVPVKDDYVALVIWYKDGVNLPIYSLDARDRILQQAAHWADEKILGGRSFFRVQDDPVEGGPHLAVENVRETDEGTYRCRVDFQNTPTRNRVVNLTVIVPPHNITILDEYGDPLVRPELGPYTEGTTVRIACIAWGGRPTPRVTWWRDNILVDDSDEVLDEDIVQNVLKLDRLERRHLDRVYSCQASNNDVLAPVSSNVTINMYLPPLDVQLVGRNRPISAGIQYEVSCQSVGSRPPAHITWWKGDVLMNHTRETRSSDGNISTSTLIFVPTPGDLRKELTCRANNTHIPGSARQDTWMLDVHYSPIVSLQLGTNLNASSLREGVDVYFECNIQANPKIYKIAWRHNGNLLQMNVSAGILFSDETLVLQSINRNTSGLYTCIASNPEGDSESNAVNLDVKYEPVCSEKQQKVYGAARLEEIQVVCEVDANPPATLFRWFFNNSAVQTLEVKSVSSAPGGGSSIASYKPQSERDYGTLLCWGRNELGSQDAPCVFHIVPAGKPDPPRNCILMNRTTNSLQVSCSRGFDGGLPQEFTMELYAASTVGSEHRRLVSNVTSRSKPEFVVTGLEPGSGYIMSIYSSNGKGRSFDIITLRVTTLKISQQENRKSTTASTTSSPDFPQVTPMLWLLAGIVSTLGLVGIVVVVIIRVRGVECDWCEGSEDDQRSSSDSLASRKGLTVALQNQGMKSSGIISTSLQNEDTSDNPDVIPHANDADYPSTDYKSLEKHSIGSSTRTFSTDSPSQTVLFGNVQGFSRAPTTESMLSCDTISAKWQPVPCRDVGTQATPSGTPTVLQTLPKSQTQHQMPKQHAETQTPLLRSQHSKPRTRARAAYSRLSDFVNGRIFAMREMGASCRQTPQTVGCSALTVERVVTRWTQDNCVARTSGTDLSRRTTGEDRGIRPLALTIRRMKTDEVRAECHHERSGTDYWKLG
ncbi:nephrin-like [Anabrus simplex]|uniref:nephrin-like n=1 Tax=Anabrus simplex TaxID=316456 RepID=UPI0035A2DF0D